MQFFSRDRRVRDAGGVDEDETAADLDLSANGAKVNRRRCWWAAAILSFVVVGLACWVVVGAFQAKSSLAQARQNAQQAKNSFLQGDTAAASASADEAVRHAQAARSATHSMAWDVASNLPWIGSPFKTGQQITDVVRSLASDLLRPAADVGIALSPDRLYRDGRVDVLQLRGQESALSVLSRNAERLNRDAQAITDPRYVSVMSDARSQIQDQISSITTIIENTALAAQLAPSMMGADGPRTYFMGFQTNAEARGTGGLIGGFGILRFDQGLPTVDALAANTDLADAIAPVDLGLEYDQQYGFANPFTDFRNSNLSPHFPYSAEIWKSMWAEKTGINIDGVIAIDPVALSYILKVVGHVTMTDGEIISSDNVVELTESTAYSRFPIDQIARKQYLQDIANAVVEKITGPLKSPRQLLDALGKAVSERRIAVWSARPQEQKVLEETPLAHVIPDDSAPYAAIVLNNLGGNKLDYYLKTEIEYNAEACTGSTRGSKVRITLTNALPDRPLPDYVTDPAGLSPELKLQAPRGTNFTSVRLFATKGANLSSVTLNGEKVPAILSAERGHPVFEVQVALPPEQTADITFEMSEPTASGVARVPSQPLISSVTPRVTVPVCSG